MESTPAAVPAPGYHLIMHEAQSAQPAQPLRPPMPAAQPLQPAHPAQPVWPTRERIPGAAAYRAAQLDYLIFGIIEVLIAARVILEILGANPHAGFTSVINGITAPFVAFFQGVFPTPQGGGSRLEISAVLAIAVYALLAWGSVRVIQILAKRGHPAATA